MEIQEILDQLRESDEECVTLTFKRRAIREDLIAELEGMDPETDLNADVNNGGREMVNSFDIMRDQIRENVKKFHEHEM